MPPTVTSEMLTPREGARVRASSPCSRATMDDLPAPSRPSNSTRWRGREEEEPMGARGERGRGSEAVQEV
eukprot:scaffold110992_cov34-Tisochrysis_lutea.AAC.3